MSDTTCRSLDAATRPSVDSRRPSLLARVRAWWRAHQTARAMLRLDDRTLRDIGLTRQALARHYRRRHFWW